MIALDKKITISYYNIYYIIIIAEKQKVSVITIRKRIKTLSVRYPIEFNRALKIRQHYKYLKSQLENPKSLTKLTDQINLIQQVF